MLTMDGPMTVAATLLCCMFLWNIFLIFDHRRRIPPLASNTPSWSSSLALLCHTIPAALFFLTTIIAHDAKDNALVWFIALIVFRYWRTFVNIFFWFRYTPALYRGRDYRYPEDEFTAEDCTVIVPTVGPNDNPVFDEMVSSILESQPKALIFSTNTELAKTEVEMSVASLMHNFSAGKTEYQRQWVPKGTRLIKGGRRVISATSIKTEVSVTNAMVSNKRQQFMKAVGAVNTGLIVMMDDTAIWHPKFLAKTLPAFNDDKVGFVGTRKWVKRNQYVWDHEASLLKNYWLRYLTGFWNTMGALYLVRHNFEIRATNAADGGVFCVSGRTSVIRTRLVNIQDFKNAFLNEYVLRLGEWFGGFGPLAADDDNFITRHVVNQGYDVKIQYSKECTITTRLGGFPLKFPEQCKRWSRTTFRQNPIALFADRTIWWKWPLTVWTTYFPWMYNAALFWDGLAVYTLLQTKIYAETAHPTVMLAGLVLCIWLSKLVKTIPWFWEYPIDFLLYFIIPAYPLFAYAHSILKIWTMLTFWNTSWSGRKLP
ncbi:hypothetical protein IQ07DRAFT_651621 [Pyrenochaeta sp. DS3sAY3a]|nr:hypothetical protein IQ07DRAFT_651621 [Pyrenochaeta sp. DS3sAY3a]